MITRLRNSVNEYQTGGFAEMVNGMKRKIMQIAAVLLVGMLLLPNAAAAQADLGRILRVGLYYGSDALISANLDNASGYGSGHRFGYFDGDNRFVQLGYTEEQQISMLKSTNIYLSATGSYSDEAAEGDRGVVGCYHLQFATAYSDFESAYSAAAALSQGFVAWISGAYYVRWGSFETSEAAKEAIHLLQQELPPEQQEVSVAWTTKYGVTVTQTRTTKILFQFDGDKDYSLGVMPDITGTENPLTWFKNIKYHGGFRYQRINGGDLTVVNFVALEDYVKGVIPYEMSGSWPLEALKAQALAARTYAVRNLNGHKSSGFDVCNTTCCQVYYGEGDGRTKYPTEVSNRAVEETAGLFLWYDGTLASTNFYSSNGGGSESAVNVWGNDYPYLIGVIDPYEETVSNIPGYHWTATFTADELTRILREKNYGNGRIVKFEVKSRSETGNVLQIMFTDENGRTYTFAREKVRTLLGLKSMRYEIQGNETTSTGFSINGDTLTETTTGLYAISGNGAVSALSSSQPYVITGTGTVSQLTTASSNSDVFVIKGTGYGHHVGMSQWGAYAMANLGYTYADILNFYYPGTYIAPEG